MPLDVRLPAAVPDLLVHGARGLEVGKVGDFRPAGVGDDCVEAAVGFDDVFDKGE